MRYEVECFSCGEVHEAEESHVSSLTGEQIYAVVCPVDDLTDYYTAEVARSVA